MPNREDCGEERTESKLYVNNIPIELEEEGLRQVFNIHGTVLSILSPTNSGWAFVTYGSYKEAELAMRFLNNKPPLSLHIEFAKEKRPLKQKQSHNENGADQRAAKVAQDFRFCEGKPREQFARQTAPQVEQIRNAATPMDFPPVKYTGKEDYRYPVEVAPGTFETFSQPDPYNETHQLWCRGHTVITQDGKRKVSLGRGYTVYAYPEVNPRAVQGITKEYEMRCRDVYEYGEDGMQNQIGKCRRCNNVAQWKCEYCEDFYCSRHCQTQDWPKHKTECQKIPRLIRAVNDMKMSDEKSALVNSAQHIFQQRAVAASAPGGESSDFLRRPNKDLAAEKISKDRPKPVLQNKTPLSPKQESPPKPQQKKSSPAPSETNSVHSVTSHRSRIHSFSGSHKGCDNAPGENDTGKRGLFNKTNGEATKQGIESVPDDVFSFQKDDFLSNEEFTLVIVNGVLENGVYCIQRQADVEEVNRMMQLLQEKAPVSPTANPIRGNIYAAYTTGFWHRVMVLSLDPLSIRLIDYGDEKLSDCNSLHILQNEFEKLPSYSRKIRFLKVPRMKEPVLEVGDSVNVKQVSIDTNGIIVVQIEEPMEPLTSPAQPDIPCILDITKIEQTGILELHACISSQTFTASFIPDNMMIPFDEVINTLPQVCTNLVKNVAPYEAKLNEYVCGKRSDEDWIRGKVLSPGPCYKLAACDEGRVAPTETIVKLPADYLRIPTFAVSIEFAEGSNDHKPGQNLVFTVNNARLLNGQNIVNITVHDKDTGDEEAIVKPWVLLPEQQGIAYAEIQSGAKVCISAFVNLSNIYIRNLSSNEVERFGRLIQDVAKCAQEAKQLTKLPVRGEMVIAKYKEDENFYRALVKDIKDDKIELIYVDFGNKEISELSRLYTMKNDLKDFAAAVRKVKLINAPANVPMNKKVTDYLATLAGREQPLICKYDGSVNEGVELFLGSESVNGKIKALLEPSYVVTPPETDNDCYMLEHIKLANLGNVGGVVECILLFTITPGKEYFLGLNDMSLVQHISVVMQEQIKDYVSKNKKHYIPRDMELCLAPFEGVYYRAHVLIKSASPSTSLVFFVDFGNMAEVQHTDIRMMTPDFLEPSTLGALCDVPDLLPKEYAESEVLPLELKKRLSELLPENEVVKVKILDFDSEKQAYNIQILGVKETLLKEGLIKA